MEEIELTQFESNSLNALTAEANKATQNQQEFINLIFKARGIEVPQQLSLEKNKLTWRTEPTPTPGPHPEPK